MIRDFEQNERIETVVDLPSKKGMHKDFESCIPISKGTQGTFCFFENWRGIKIAVVFFPNPFRIPSSPAASLLYRVLPIQLKRAKI